MIVLYLTVIFLLQSTVLAKWTVFGARPDLVLLSVICFALLLKRSKAVWLAVACGFLSDIMSLGAYLNTILLTVIGAAAVEARENYDGEKFSLAVILALIISPAKLVAEALAHHYLYGQIVDLFQLFWLLIGQTALNIIFLPVIYKIVEHWADAE